MALQSGFDAFNPDVPDKPPRDPNYMGYAQEVGRDYKQVSSAGMAAKDVGDVLGSAIKGSDEIVKTFARVGATDLARGVREDYAQVVNAQDGIVRLAALPQPSSPDTPTAPVRVDVNGNPIGGTDVLPQSANDKPLPPSLQRLPQSLSSLEGARASGKISETDYYARLMKVAKDYRSQYPVGYHEYIDDQISKITGVDPANAFIKSVIGDINSFTANQQAEKKQIDSMFEKAVQDGTEGAKEAWGRYKRTGNWDSAVSWINDANKGKNIVAQQELQRKYLDNNKSMKGDQWEKDFSSNAYRQSSNMWTTLIDELKSHGMQADENGNWGMDSKQRVFIAQLMQNKALQFKSFLEAQANQKDAAGDTFRSLKGPEVQKQIDAAMTMWTDQIANLRGEGKTGQIGLSAALVKAAGDDDTLKLYGAEGSEIIRKMGVAKHIGGDASAAILMNQPGSVVALDKLFKYQKLEALTQDPMHPKSIQEMFTGALKAGTGAGMVVPPEHYDDLIKQITGKNGLLSGDLKDPQILSIASVIASPNNKQLISNIKPDYYDPETKQYHSGQIDAYRLLTSKDVSKKMFEVGDKYKFIADNYKDTAGSWFREGIFKPELQKMKSMEDKGYRFVWSDGEHGRIGWDVLPPARVLGADRRAMSGEFNRVKAMVERVNAGVQGLANVAGAAGADVNAAVLGQFEQLGFDLKKDTYVGLPYRMLEQLKKTQQESEESKAKAKKLEK